MSGRIKTTGGDEIRQAIEKRGRRSLEGAMRGMSRAQALVRREAVKRTPIDTGNLRSSATTPRPRVEGGKIIGQVSYTAAYAPFVHENLEANFNAPGTGPKFLERAIRENQQNIQRLLGSGANVET